MQMSESKIYEMPIEQFIIFHLKFELKSNSRIKASYKILLF